MGLLMAFIYGGFAVWGSMIGGLGAIMGSSVLTFIALAGLVVPSRSTGTNGPSIPS